MIFKQLLALPKSEKKAFVIANAKDLIAAKKEEGKATNDCATYYEPRACKAVKAQIKGASIFDIVGNSVGFMDAHYDVSMAGSFNKTVKEGAQKAYFLKDHIPTSEGIVGLNHGVRVGQVAIRELGYDRDGFTEAFIMSVEPLKELDEKVYNLYKRGLITQHSIGLQYVKIDLAINDPDSEEHYKVWQANIDKVINREMAEEVGYFFPIFEQKVAETSAVTFASNPYTPPLKAEPSEPPTLDEPKKGFKQSFFQALIQKDDSN